MTRPDIVLSAEGISLAYSPFDRAKMRLGWDDALGMRRDGSAGAYIPDLRSVISSRSTTSAGCNDSESVVGACIVCSPACQAELTYCTYIVPSLPGPNVTVPPVNAHPGFQFQTRGDSRRRDQTTPNPRSCAMPRGMQLPGVTGQSRRPGLLNSHTVTICHCGWMLLPLCWSRESQNNFVLLGERMERAMSANVHPLSPSGVKSWLWKSVC